MAKWCDTLFTNQVLKADEKLIARNRKWELVMQGDGNCCLYANGKCVFMTNTAKQGSYAKIDDTGVFHVYNKHDKPIWSSNPAQPKDAYKLQLGVDGNLVIYSSADVPISHTNTSQDVIPHIMVRN